MSEKRQNVKNFLSEIAIRNKKEELADSWFTQKAAEQKKVKINGMPSLNDIKAIFK